LFDYLNDRHATRLVNILYQRLSDNGILVIGNFSLHNPSRSCIEFGSWYLIYRTPKDMLQLAKNAKINSNLLSIDAEPSGINIFVGCKAIQNSVMSRAPILDRRSTHSMPPHSAQ
jgi:hypothetical protein